MQTKLKGKHFITTQDWSVQELKTLFEMAKQLKLEFAAGRFANWGKLMMRIIALRSYCFK